jgi:putative intracellular protease/amidase
MKIKFREPSNPTFYQSADGKMPSLKLGAVFSKVKDWEVHVVSDGLLITGQNPASSGPAAKTPPRTRIPSN